MSDDKKPTRAGEIPGVTYGGMDLREMLKSGSEFRKLEVPYYLKAGTTVYAFDAAAFEGEALTESDVLAKLKPIVRPTLVVGEKIVTTGICGEIRVGEIVRILEDTTGNKHGIAFDGAMYMSLDFDKDRDHEWTMCGMWTKEFAERFGKS